MQSAYTLLCNQCIPHPCDQRIRIYAISAIMCAISTIVHRVPSTLHHVDRKGPPSIACANAEAQSASSVPARMPKHEVGRLQRRERQYSMVVTAMQPAPPESMVRVATLAATRAPEVAPGLAPEPGPESDSTLPVLKASQPNQRKKVPSMMNDDDCPRKSTAVARRPAAKLRQHRPLPPLCGPPCGKAAKRPARGPTTMQAERARTPPVRWTTPLPAKSKAPPSSAPRGLRTASHPSADHSQWHTAG
mmetsp:Transcript_5431/g.14317  ORF Transcript_5431/g.14317 Transcript_5431/m.14317 type:complete len:247 (-) Transcript_5431:459-1199(-)